MLGFALHPVAANVVADKIANLCTPRVERFVTLTPSKMNATQCLSYFIS